MKTDFSNLPKHWKIKKLKEIVVSQKGKAPTHWFDSKIDDALPYLDVEALDKNNITQFVDWYSTTWVDEQDICILWDGARNGLILKGKKGALGSTLYCLSPLVIDTNYLFYYLKTQEKLRKETRHVESTFWEMEIPIPPIEEQEHIAQAIQQAYQDFDTQNQEAERKLLEAFRKLVPIQSEDLDNIIGLEDFKKAVLDLAVNGNIINKNYSLTSKLKTVITQIEAGKSFRCKESTPKENEIGVLKVSAISSGEYNENESKTCTDISKIDEKLFVKPNDFIISRLNTIDLVGSCVIVKVANKQIMLSDNTLRVLFKDTVNQEFILYMLQSSLGRVQIETFAKGNIESMKYITQDHIDNIDIFLPKLEEQNQIVTLIKNIFTEVDKIKKDFDLQNKQKNETLKSIINAFFQDSKISAPTNDWDLDTQIKETRKKKEKEILELKKKQKEYQKTLFDFGDMKKDDKERIKKKIRLVAEEKFAPSDALTQEQIDVLRDSVKGIANKSYNDDDFATVFLEMAQENFANEDTPFFEAIKNNDTLAFKFAKK